MADILRDILRIYLWRYVKYNFHVCYPVMLSILTNNTYAQSNVGFVN